MEAVLEVYGGDGFGLWPVAEVEGYGFMALNGGLTPAEVGTAVMRIASANDIDSGHDERPPRPADPLGAFLHGLLTVNSLIAPGGLRVVDGVAVVPGCCSGLEDWREWYGVLDGDGCASFGHDPLPTAERRDEIVRLTVDAEHEGGPVIDLSVAELRGLLVRAERDLLDFLALATDWAHHQLSHHADSVTAALARALDLRREGQ
ncbi:hypothetical protein [Actinocrispum sp. NPDC049592]|uniref:hypothetical protein n=1 Tax=Actinocrispum sp. NPDC049592 TaxID=3154835 RepID=UPI003449E8B3